MIAGDAGNGDAAIKLFTQAIDIDRAFAEAWQLRALANEDATDSLRDIDKAIQLAPDVSKSWAIKCSIVSRGGKDDRLAESLCSKAIDLDPKNDTALVFRAMLRKDGRLALDDYRRATEAAPTNARWWLFRANGQQTFGDTAGSIVSYTKFLTLAPDQPEVPTAYAARANAHLVLKEYSAAFDDTKKALSMDYQNSKAHRVQCYYHFRMGDDIAALESCNKAIKFEPDHPEAYQFRSEVYNKLGRAAEAAADVNTAATLRLRRK
jgi:tetratricopeptide (TPR) repeat protein